jgi:pimeloyl-ACP methyl ester carboxylesterase
MLMRTFASARVAPVNRRARGVIRAVGSSSIQPGGTPGPEALFDFLIGWTSGEGIMFTLIVLGLLLLPFLVIGGGLALFWRRKRRAIWRWCVILYSTAALLLVFVIGPYLMARILVHANSRPLDLRLRETPADFGISYEEIGFAATDSLNLKGWFVPPSGKNAILICTHGLFRTRVEMLSRAMAVAKAGYGVLLYDSRSHGTSSKGIVSLGYFEKNDVLGAVRYIESRYPDCTSRPKIVLFGISMGAVATLEAAAQSKEYSALILDSPFSSLQETIADHTWLFLGLPRYPFAPFFLFWFQRLAGYDPRQVNSHQAMSRVQPVPLLIIGSEGDRRIPSEVARSLYRESRSRMKKLEIFGPEVGHGAAARLHPEAYARLLLNFLDSALGNS